MGSIRSTCALAMILLLLAAAGCQSAAPPRRLYEGAVRPPAEVATLAVERHVFVTRIDDQVVYLGVGTFDEDSAVEVLPGQHKAVIGVQADRAGWTFSRGSVTFPFTVEAGRRYVFRAEVKDGRWWRPLLVDEQTKRVVAAGEMQ